MGLTDHLRKLANFNRIFVREKQVADESLSGSIREYVPDIDPMDAPPEAPSSVMMPNSDSVADVDAEFVDTCPALRPFALEETDEIRKGVAAATPINLDNIAAGRRKAVLAHESSSMIELGPDDALDDDLQEDLIEEDAGLADDGPAWDKLPLIRSLHENQMTGGNPERYGNFLRYALERWGGSLPKQELRALVLGATEMPPVAQQLLGMKRVASVAVADLAGRLDRADLPESAETYALNLRELVLPEGPFEVIVAYESLRQFYDLESLLEQMASRLVSGGLLIIRDYAGDGIDAYSSDQLHLAEALLRLLPEDLRSDDAGIVRDNLNHLRRDRLQGVDTIQHVQLWPLLREQFNVVESVPLGGTLLGPLLSGIGNRFLEDDDEATLALDTLIATEQTLIAGGLIESDTVFAIARNT